jgi:hypothetical protein
MPAGVSEAVEHVLYAAVRFEFHCFAQVKTVKKFYAHIEKIGRAYLRIPSSSVFSMANRV